MTSKTPVHLFQSHKVDLLSRVGGTESRLEKKEHETQAGPDVDKEHDTRGLDTATKGDFVPNSRPPTREIYDAKNLSKGILDWNIHNASVDSDNNDRPFSARSTKSMSFSLHEGRPMSAQSMRATLSEARKLKDTSESDLIAVDKHNKHKKWLVWLAVVLSLIFVVVIITVSLLATENRQTAGRKSKENTNEVGTTTDSALSITQTTGTNDASDADSTISLSTVPPAIIIIDENDNSVYGGTWSSWESWSECTLSCASGIQQRMRSCETSDLQCQGVSIQEQRCNTALCPIIEPEGVWTTWGVWSECDASCGTGQQRRIRDCVSMNDTEVISDDCTGGVDQHRQCNTFECPDCDQSCAEGILQSCAYCECSATVFGQVLGTDNLPLRNITISPGLAPYVTLGITELGGYFNISGICYGQDYVFRGNGYLDTEIAFVEVEANVTMERFVPLRMVTNPQSRMSIFGDRIELCCEVYGVPGPDYYEWMKNGDLELTTTDSTFAIESASVNDTAYYNCRASNDHSAIYSSTASILVKDSEDDFCSSNPQSHVISLPNDCHLNNITTIDKGRCESNGCYGGANEGCYDSTSHCCGPTQLSTINVECETYTLPVHLITECGCTVCRAPQLTIYGFAGSREGDPLQYGDIFWNGSLVTNTSDDGSFSFTVDKGVTRASILFVDAFNRTFLDSTYVFEMPESETDSYYVRVVLFRRGQPHPLNSTVENTLELNGTLLDIPAESFYTIDGQMFEGEVTAFVATIDPSNLEEMASAPGDLSIIDQDGDSQQLLSYGMFALSFEDSDGNRLSIPGEITITVPQDQFGDSNDTSQIRVWTLNPSTGLWEFASDLQEEEIDEETSRKKRQIRPGGWGQRSYRATLRGIPIHTQWFNFDAISTQTCVVKVRLFENDRFHESDQIHYGRVSVVVQDSNGYNSLSSNRVATDTRNNGYCMVLPCESRRSRSSSRFRGFIFADVGGEELFPASDLSDNGLQNSRYDLYSRLNYLIQENTIQVDFNQRLVHSEGLGPFYDWDRKWRYSSACSRAGTEENHFRFSRLVNCLIETDAYNIVPGSGFSQLPLHLLLWYDISSHFPYVPRISPITRRFWAYKSCYVKVLAPRNSIVEAVSYISDERHFFYDNASSFYGKREDCAFDGAVCLQIRPPGRPRIAAYDDLNSLDFERHTLIKIRLIDQPERVVDIADELFNVPDIYERIVTNISAYENTFQMYIEPQWNYGSRYGIYCHQGETEEIAEQALYSCRNGGDNAWSRFPTRTTVEDGWAVKFGSPPRRSGSDCKSLYESGIRTDGIYTINPDGFGEFDVYCELDDVRSDGTSEGGWTVIQRRVDDSVNFYRGWDEYEDGFGDLDGNLWLGLANIYRLTEMEPLELHVYLESFSGSWYYATFSQFSIAGSSDNYRLQLAGVFDGTALAQSLLYHNGMQFSTYDRDNDDVSWFDCAASYYGAWWYSTCHDSNLNGRYVHSETNDCQGIIWDHVPYSGTACITLRKVVMKVR